MIGDCMFRMTVALGSLLVLALSTSGTPGGPLSYLCEITSYLPADGEAGPEDWVAENAMDTPVAIDRASGMVIHPYIGNSTFLHREVLDPGSEEWGFKVIAYSSPQPNRHLRYVEAQEYAEGPEKPFLAVSDDVAYAGTCQ